MARYTLIVGTRTLSSWSLRPFLALSAIGEPFETVVIRLRIKPPEPITTRDLILEHSAAGKVPVLKIEEQGKALTVWDSLAICETLAERHPQAGLWPQDAWARALARAYACEMHSGFPDVRDQLSLAFGKKLPLPQLREETGQQIARILAAWDDALKTANGPFLFGRFSIADCMYAPVVSRFETYGVPVPSLVRAYMDEILALPGMKSWGEGAQQEAAAGIA
ncbi:MAG TPA: glutathione S-transferase [Rhizomicrobium sp.]|nr:glutathione S-transferase [Rhizomicrobium sp.]